MKKIALLPLMLLTLVTAFAQNNVVNPYPRTITVTGSAEMEIVPDEIYVQVDLKEYDKKGSGKISIDQIRQEFLTAVRSLGLPDSSVSVAGYDGNTFNPWWRKKNKKEGMYASISYWVKLRNTTQIDQLVDKLDDNATQNFFIQRTSHSKLEQFKRQLKIQAVLDARQKAEYLAGAVNEKIGVAVTINEPNEYYQPYMNTMAFKRNELQEAVVAGAPADQPQADFRKIKIRYNVSAVFELK